MTETTPNPEQQALIDDREGIYVVDAGAGTGKTFTITRRYAGILSEPSTEPDDILLVTFTNNAAAEMKERVVTEGEYSMSELRDAPITTFHAWCHELLRTHGIDAPTQLGIDDHITSSTTLLENEVIEADHFRTFFRGFVDDHPAHHDIVRIINNIESLLGLIKELAAKGVFPTADGWYRDGESTLAGDFEVFRERFAETNEPNEGANGPKYSDLMNSLSGFGRDHCVPPDAPTETDLRGDSSQLHIDPKWAREAFEEDRAELKAFIHDVYFEYLVFALERNFLNFPFLQLFAFVLLCNDHKLRRSLRYEYVMVDEFQDTSEIQFKLALLLCGSGNFCAVGDWKQSIYSFQYASVDNIRRFEARLSTFVDDLNTDHPRIEFPIGGVESRSLTRNYRSTQSILDASEQSLTLPATADEAVDPGVAEAVTHLQAQTDREHSIIKAFQADDGLDAVLDRIQHIYDNERFAVKGDDGSLRAPTYDDIAILTRKRRFGRRLQARADEFDIPVAYEGGVNLFETEPAILLLAWLRVLEDADDSRGWAVILEEAGYTIDEIDHCLNVRSIPENMLEFRGQLAERNTIGEMARGVFERYGLDDGYTDALITTVQSVTDQTLRTRGDIVRFLEQSIEAEATAEVIDAPGGDAVTVQTIHSAKGLEYPIVIIADVTEHSFPSRGGGFEDRIRFAEPIGIRQSKLYNTEVRPHVYDNWCYRLVSACLPTEYDEERRLLYVAMTRAEHHLLFVGGEQPSQFFTTLDVPTEEIEPVPEMGRGDTNRQMHLQIAIPAHDAPIGHSPHTLMDDRVFEEVSEGRGRSFGNAVHEFAERYAKGEPVDVDPDATHPDTANLKRFIDGMEGKRIVEEYAYLPLEIDGRQVTISGVIDLVHIRDSVVEVIDYKTDLTDHAQAQYRIQLSIYYHVLAATYPDREIVPKIYYTYSDRLVEIDPFPTTAIGDLVQRRT